LRENVGVPCGLAYGSEYLENDVPFSCKAVVEGRGSDNGKIK